MLKQELRVKGIDPETINEVIEEAEIDEVAAAIAVAEKAASRLRGLDPQVARRRLTGQLARRGFGYDAIRQALKQVLDEADDEEALEE
jgi:regulatory protein